MTTASDIVHRALRALLNQDPGESVAAEDVATGLAALNDMLHGWRMEYGVDLGHSVLALADTLTLPDDHIRTVRFNLVIALAPEFPGSTVDAVTAAFAERGLRALQAVYSQVPELKFDRGLQNRVRVAGGTERFSG